MTFQCYGNQVNRRDILALETFGCSPRTTPSPTPVSACELPYWSSRLNMSLHHRLRTLRWNTNHITTSSYEIKDTAWPPLLNPLAYLDIRMSRLLSGHDTYQLQN